MEYKKYSVALILLFTFLWITPTVVAVGSGDVVDDLDKAGLGVQNYSVPSTWCRMPTGIGNGPNGGDLYLAYADGTAYTYEFTSSGTISLVSTSDVSAVFDGSGGTSGVPLLGMWAYSSMSNVYVLLAAGAGVNYEPTIATFAVSSGGAVNNSALSTLTFSTHAGEALWTLYNIEGTDDVIASLYASSVGWIVTWDIDIDGSITQLDSYHMGAKDIPNTFRYLWSDGAGDIYAFTGYDTDSTTRLWFMSVTDDGNATIAERDRFDVPAASWPDVARLGTSYDVIMSYADGTLGVVDCTAGGTITGWAGTTLDWDTGAGADKTVRIRHISGDVYALVFKGYAPNIGGNHGNYVYTFECPDGTTDMSLDNMLNYEQLPDWYYATSPLVYDLGNMPDRYMIVSSGTYNAGVHYSAFTTLAVNVGPEVTTDNVAGITDTEAVAYGSVTDIGSSVVTTVGFCWNTTGFPTVSGSKTAETVSITGTASFSATVPTLTGDTHYYLRAYATSADGTGYGSDYEFNTSPSYSTYILNLDFEPEQISGTPSCTIQDQSSYNQDAVYVLAPNPDSMSVTVSPVTTHNLAVYSGTDAAQMEYISEAPGSPDTYFTDDDVTFDNFVGMDVMNVVLDEGEIPRRMFWLPMIMGVTIVIGFAVFGFSGHLLALAIGSNGVLFFAAGMEWLDWWVIPIFLIYTIGILLSERSYNFV